MHKRSIEVLQIIVRENNEKKPEEIALALNTSSKNIYYCFQKLREQNILTKENKLSKTKLANDLKKIFVKYPYNFTFLTKTNLEIMSYMLTERKISEIIQESNKSKFSVNKLIQELRSKGFINKKNKVVNPNELIEIINDYNNPQNEIELTDGMIIIAENEKRKIIQTIKKIQLKLHKTAFSAMKNVGETTHNYYTTKIKEPTKKEIIKDAMEIETSQRELKMIKEFEKD